MILFYVEKFYAASKDEHVKRIFGDKFQAKISAPSQFQLIFQLSKITNLTKRVKINFYDFSCWKAAMANIINGLREWEDESENETKRDINKFVVLL